MLAVLQKQKQTAVLFFLLKNSVPSDCKTHTLQKLSFADCKTELQFCKLAKLNLSGVRPLVATVDRGHDTPERCFYIVSHPLHHISYRSTPTAMQCNNTTATMDDLINVCRRRRAADNDDDDETYSNFIDYVTQQRQGQQRENFLRS